MNLLAENSIPVFSITEKGNRITQDEDTHRRVRISVIKKTTTASKERVFAFDTVDMAHKVWSSPKLQRCKIRRKRNEIRKGWRRIARIASGKHEGFIFDDKQLT